MPLILNSPIGVLHFVIAMVQLEQLCTIKVSFYAFMLARTEYSYRILMS